MAKFDRVRSVCDGGSRDDERGARATDFDNRRTKARRGGRSTPVHAPDWQIHRGDPQELPRTSFLSNQPVAFPARLGSAESNSTTTHRHQTAWRYKLCSFLPQLLGTLPVFTGTVSAPVNTLRRRANSLVDPSDQRAGHLARRHGRIFLNHISTCASGQQRYTRLLCSVGPYGLLLLFLGVALLAVVFVSHMAALRPRPRATPRRTIQGGRQAGELRPASWARLSRLAAGGSPNARPPARIVLQARNHVHHCRCQSQQYLR